MTNKQRLKWIGSIALLFCLGAMYDSVARANCTSAWQTTWTSPANCSTNGRTGQSLGVNGDPKVLWAQCVGGSCASPYQVEATGVTSNGTFRCWTATASNGSSTFTNCSADTVKHNVGVYGP
jgi:hypothetical protein